MRTETQPAAPVRCTVWPLEATAVVLDNAAMQPLVPHAEAATAVPSAGEATQEVAASETDGPSE